VEIKSAIVAEDEKESGRREALNFGHTVAHALEAMSAFTMLHGYAVGLGMIAEAALGESLGVTTSGTARTITEALHAAHLPTVVNARWSEDQIIDAMRSDKKARHGQIRCAIPAALGTMLEDSHSWSIAAPPDALRAALRSITQNDTSQPEDR
jgi:3-dehydroquinate synthase